MHLVHILPGNRWSGVMKYALDICSHYKSTGCKVTAFTCDAKAVDTPFARAGVELIHAPLFGNFDFASAKKISSFFKNSKESRMTVHVHDFRTAFTALLARKLSHRTDIRIVLTRHKVKPAHNTWLMHRIYRNLDAMVFVSHTAAGRFLSTWHSRQLPFDASKVKVIHNSLNLPYDFTPSPDPPGAVTAMFHGPLIEGKGLETLIDAMAILKGQRIRLKIAGSGTSDYVDSIRRRAINRGVMESIDWHKHSEHPMELIASSHFGVLPSWNEEAFGLSNIEYMACGRPQICSSNGAQPEYITDGHEGFLVTPGNATSIAEAMRKLASEASLRARMGRHAAESFRNNLSWPFFIKLLDNIYFPEK